MSTQVILLEKMDNLGEMGDVVSVRPGYARNYLLPQKKALRANKENIAYFETQKAALQAANDKKKAEAEKNRKKVEGQIVAVLRQASESGQLFGSVNSRDIAEQITEQTSVAVQRSMIVINDNFKTIGLFPLTVVLHPEVKVDVTLNIARNADEAKIQAETGKALTGEQEEEQEPQSSDDAEKDEAFFEVLPENEEAQESGSSEEPQENADDAEEKSA